MLERRRLSLYSALRRVTSSVKIIGCSIKMLPSLPSLSGLSLEQLTQLSDMVKGLIETTPAPTTLAPAPTTLAPTTLAPAPTTPAPTTTPAPGQGKAAINQAIGRLAAALQRQNEMPAPKPWNLATATYYSSYPECCSNKAADQTECRDYSGCKYEGKFAAFGDKKMDKKWVENTNIVAFYQSPNSKNRQEWSSKWKNKKIRLRNPKTKKVMEAVILDTCDDGDCNGCCSTNANRNGGYLVDLEINTAKRFYDGKLVGLGPIEWQIV